MGTGNKFVGSHSSKPFQNGFIGVESVLPLPTKIKRWIKQKGQENNFLESLGTARRKRPLK
jgi:hypothetical protein